MKKIFFIIVLVITILGIISGILFYKINNKELSKEQFENLMNKFQNIKNVKIESESGDITYIKDRYGFSIRRDGICFWSDKNSKEYIGFVKETKTYTVLEENNDEENLFENAKYTFMRI